MTTLGAIVWPYHQAPATADRSRKGEEAILSPSAYRHLLPFYGEAVDATNISFADSSSQEIVDKILAMCVACGLDYVSIDYYADALGYLAPTGGIEVWEGINNFLQRYLASPWRSRIKFALVLVGDDLGVASPPVVGDWPTVRADIVQYLQRPEYVTIADGRPLVYIINPEMFNTRMGGAGTSCMTSLRTALQGVGFPGNGMCLVSMSNNLALGADVASAYAEFLPAGTTSVSYAALTAAAAAKWQTNVSASRYTIPLATVGWDFRPRTANTFWNTKVGTGRPGGYGPIENTDGNYVDGQNTTPQAIADHIKAGFDFVAANPTYCGPTDSVNVYALDEFSEAGNGLLPCAMHAGKEPVLQVLARTLRRQLDSARALKARGLPVVNRPDRARAYY